MATGVIDQILHFQKTDLVKAAGKDVDDMAIVRRAFGEVIVKLPTLAFPQLRLFIHLNPP